jgi:hypothetical protein
MARDAIDIEVKGLRELQRETERIVMEMHGEPMLRAMRDATLLVSRDAKINAPVNTGRLRASILPEVRANGTEVMGVVGSNLEYAPWMELGTGTFAGNAPHKIGIDGVVALAQWAMRKRIVKRTKTGLSELSMGYIIALGIMRRGGLKPRLFLTNAFKKNESRIIARIERAVKEITTG